MSVLTDLWEKKITFSQAVSRIVPDVEKVFGSSTAATSGAAQVLSDAKQAASDAVSMADSALAAYIIPASKTVETALETALAGATKGVSLPFNPLITDGIDTIANAIKAQADAWALAAKAKLTTATTSAVAPTLAPTPAPSPQPQPATAP